MVRRLRSTALLAAADPRSVSFSTSRLSLRFSLMSSATMSLSCWISSGPPRRLPARPVAPARVARRAGRLAPSSGAIGESLGRGQNLLPRQAFQAFARQLVGWVRLPADITDHAPAAPAALPDLVDCDAKAVARWHPAAHDRRAVGPDDDAVVRPARRREIQRPRADVRPELG